MSFDLPGEINPFEAPRAGIGAEALYRDLADDEDAELIRREHLAREANIRSLGRLGYLGGCVTAIFATMIGLMVAGVIEQPPNMQGGGDAAFMKVFMGFAAFFYLLATLVFVGLGYGLTHLNVWARWTTVVLAALALIYVAFSTLVLSYLVSPALGVGIGVVGGGFNGLIIALLVTSKSGVVFSSEYREVIRKTPHIKQRTSIIVKVMLVILVAVIMLVMMAALFGGNR